VPDEAPKQLPKNELFPKQTMADKIDAAFSLAEEEDPRAEEDDANPSTGAVHVDSYGTPEFSVPRGGIGFPLGLRAIPAAPQIYALLSKVMAEVKAVGKTGVNQQQGYNFRGIDAVVNALGPAMRLHGVVPVPKVKKVDYRETMTTGNKPTREVTVQVRYRFYAPDGSHVDADVIGESLDQSDKGSAKAMSVAYRIALLQVFALPTDEPDPDASYHTRDGVGSMSESVANLIYETVPDASPDRLVSYWEIVMEHAAAERPCWNAARTSDQGPTNTQVAPTWVQYFADRFAELIDGIERWQDGKAVMEALEAANLGGALSGTGNERSALTVRLKARADYLKERNTKTYNHVMEEIQAAKHQGDIETAIGCAEAAQEADVLSGGQVQELIGVARERGAKLPPAPDPAEVEREEYAKQQDELFHMQLVSAAATAKTADDVADLLSNGRELRLFVASSAEDYAIVQKAAYRIHAEGLIDGDQRAELEKTISEHALMSGVEYKGYDLP
jgi:hypothetical protein